MHSLCSMDAHPQLMTPAFSDMHLAGRQGGHAPRPESRAIRMEFTIRADTRRLFHVLTVPEYLETWLCLPGHHPGCSTTATRIKEDFLLEHYCGGNAALSITGSYLVCRRRNVCFSWSVNGDLYVPDTRVHIRLRGDFESSTLILQHSGFGSSSDCKWHEDLWTASMAKLMRLYDASDSLDSARL